MNIQKGHRGEMGLMAGFDSWLIATSNRPGDTGGTMAQDSGHTHTHTTNSQRLSTPAGTFTGSADSYPGSYSTDRKTVARLHQFACVSQQSDRHVLLLLVAYEQKPPP